MDTFNLGQAVGRIVRPRENVETASFHEFIYSNFKAFTACAQRVLIVSIVRLHDGAGRILRL